ncbi:MAG: outer membrane beta-barrel protein [Candidatus Latescibacteria bacterium]|nr:outer membrane beta-barrel protein [Candidatus Latescibacterota bacterium]NIM66383.1 outer membrane beta-barrel protein [Candidatus Latescibacterota bacterium]NIO02862.1 outer membrane beta-barrel protein [Candidatus Latescibacterota bacterium]NIO29997.1 outer membrane beta-barrel protein [Candidatus Latescibacterota bacterium]NIO57612.1 outer membrane beta-barrel protein [Candidatus Latescibacterota bacterium]
MFKRTILFCIFCTVCLNATLGFTQVHLRPGISGGFVYSSFRYDDTPDFWDPGWRGGFAGGVFLEISLKRTISIVPGVGYLRLADHRDITFPVTVINPYAIFGEAELSQDYITIPVLLKVKPVRSTGLFLTVGSEIGILISANGQSTLITEIAPDSVLIVTEDEDVSDGLRSTNVFGNIGLGFEQALGIHKVIGEIRYQFGLVGNGKRGRWLTDWKTQAVLFLAGFAW